MKKTFEDFLMEKHAEQYVGTKDCIVDDFGDWLSDLSPDEFIEYGDKFAKDQIGNISVELDAGKVKKLIYEYNDENKRDSFYTPTRCTTRYPIQFKKHIEDIAQHLADNIGEIIKGGE